MTTIDPYDYDDNSFEGTYLNIQDPEIKVWNNVTYADNYYQTKGIGNTINGRELAGTNWKSDWNVSLGNRAGFTPDDGEGASHRAALAWRELLISRVANCHRKTVTQFTAAWAIWSKTISPMLLRLGILLTILMLVLLREILKLLGKVLVRVGLTLF
ncbi:MAG: hypothetical protein EAZ94_17405 [Oscillatoriales cyanobacterium]|uniref:hypothetical protein n=1 Tax=unclassified Microcoleus TaxID=2642155 RepID=UPI001DD43991|nr:MULTISPECIES: hypothetical protein [unclassified Microcoleus]MCC3581401.1 hypothetical protein [Microcoleus sp. PH2017_32_RDM_D_A]TAE10952.1 MAG: hypothetical protein EAZ94_17405 [Oscillatoriales cyanobacterium]